MHERVTVPAVGSPLGEGGLTNSCACTALCMTSATFIAPLWSLSDALLLNMSTSASLPLTAAQKRCSRDWPWANVKSPLPAEEDPQVRAPTSEQHCAKQSCHHDRADDCQPFYVWSRVRALTFCCIRALSPLPVCLYEEKFGRLYSSKTRASKNSSGVVFQSQKLECSAAHHCSRASPCRRARYGPCGGCWLALRVAKLPKVWRPGTSLTRRPAHAWDERF